MNRDYNVEVVGCDGDTGVIASLTDEEAACLIRVAAQVTAASEFNCHPRMVVWLVGDPKPDLDSDDSDGAT